MSANKCFVCLRKLSLDEENICKRCDLKDDDDKSETMNNVNCGVCNDIVEEDSVGISCDICHTWYHNYCCQNPLIENLYSLLNEAPINIKWFCDKCIWETEKWFENIRVTMVSDRAGDKESKYQDTAHSKEPEIKIEVQNDSMPIDSDDNQSIDGPVDSITDSYIEERKKAKRAPRALLKNAYKCNQCEKTFSYKTSFMKHASFHTMTEPYTCNHCDAVLPNIDDLERHLKTHIGDRIFKCSYCGKRFINQSRLNIHERIHTGEKPYICSHCGKSFTQENQLTKHERVHTGEKPYKCSHCDKAFTRPDNLKNHERTHTGEKPYQCGHCGRVFARYDNFKQHERIHTGEKPYQCEQCEKSFRAKSGLREHYKTHTGEKPCQCSICGKCFRDTSSRRQHMKTHIGNETFQNTTVTSLAIVTQPNSIVHESTASSSDLTRTSLSSINLPMLSSIPNTNPTSVTPHFSRPILASSSSAILTPHQMPICLMPSQSLSYPPRLNDQYEHS